MYLHMENVFPFSFVHSESQDSMKIGAGMGGKHKLSY